MAGYAKGILIAVLASLAIMILVNFAFFFPWYITVIETAFEVAQVVSNENYLPYDTYYDIYDGLRDKPIFRDKAEDISIEVTHLGENRSANEARYSSGDMGADWYYERSSKPYVQRGNTVQVTVKATYPFKIQFAGREITASDLPIVFSIKTTTLKHYKDLDYYVD